MKISYRPVEKVSPACAAVSRMTTPLRFSSHSSPVPKVETASLPDYGDSALNPQFLDLSQAPAAQPEIGRSAGARRTVSRLRQTPPQLVVGRGVAFGLRLGRQQLAREGAS